MISIPKPIIQSFDSEVIKKEILALLKESYTTWHVLDPMPHSHLFLLSSPEKDLSKLKGSVWSTQEFKERKKIQLCLVFHIYPKGQRVPDEDIIYWDNFGVRSYKIHNVKDFTYDMKAFEQEYGLRHYDEF